MTLDITQQLTKHVGQFSCQLEEMDTEGTLVSQSPVFYVAVKRSIKVGADVNVNWYGDMLSSDKVHPSESGAKALFAQVLLDLPEVMLDNL